MATPVRVLGISGSLRRASYNTGLLHAAAELLPEGMSLEQADISEIPLYNQDVNDAGFPKSVQALRDKVAAADALLIATPEYNHSIPGVLKNTIDWVSRPPNQPLSGKPLAIMGASPGMLGTARAQMALRQVCVFTNLLPINKPEVLVARANEKFDAEGKLTDEATRKLIRQLLEGLAASTRRLSQGGAVT